MTLNKDWTGTTVPYYCLGKILTRKISNTFIICSMFNLYDLSVSVEGEQTETSP